jgi:phage tail-like protein
MEVEVHSAHKFVVEIEGVAMAAFTECTLPTLELEIMEYKEGGQNEYTHVLPGLRKTGRLILGRGLTKDTELFKWYLDVLDGKVKKATKPVSIVMFDTMGNELTRWNFERAIPVKWTGPTLKSDAGAVAIEKLELVVHGYIPA